ncbi:nitrous oxide reductase accessory protein NosL [Rubellimicrobium arenae]|uniref:nitrous oxide reductase accessory protein NosL n=1 Tax=Rubellimicrobium arenae TaxID=2817372 RepID=UPI001B30500F|nr:nitrous oxide reductase accessory protein NosL [Rubellimicrobium arenae]
MNRLTLAACALLALAACRTEEAALPAPATLTADALDTYCQMVVIEHPGPKGQIHLKGQAEPLFFAQVRDAIAYQRMPEQSAPIAAAYVSDMGAPGATWDQPGTDNWIPADTAFYVEGSALSGGMGAPELVPFGAREQAAAFAEVNGGRVLRLDEIPDRDVLAPVPSGEDPAPDGAEADYLERLHAIAPEGEG